MSDQGQNLLGLILSLTHDLADDVPSAFKDTGFPSLIEQVTSKHCEWFNLDLWQVIVSVMSVLSAGLN